jgi:hypothetical protein
VTFLSEKQMATSQGGLEEEFGSDIRFSSASGGRILPEEYSKVEKRSVIRFAPERRP